MTCPNCGRSQIAVACQYCDLNQEPVRYVEFGFVHGEKTLTANGKEVTDKLIAQRFQTLMDNEIGFPDGE